MGAMYSGTDEEVGLVTKFSFSIFLSITCSSDCSYRKLEELLAEAKGMWFCCDENQLFRIFSKYPRIKRTFLVIKANGFEILTA